jgi:enamine deaminase RidA (YjgF/YER057c/UK114 family)
MSIEFVQPEHFPKPMGYANGAITTGRLLHVAGQIGWETDMSFASDDLVDQFAKALDNVIDVVRAAGAEPTSVARMTIYCTDLDGYRSGVKRLGGVWRERFGKHYPAMALVGVAGLVHPQAKIEIEAVAVMPPAE